jgi:hypothetical protein
MKARGVLCDRMQTYWDKNKNEGILNFILSGINLINS